MAKFMRGIQRYPPHKLSTLSYNFAIAMCKYTGQTRCPNRSYLFGAKCVLVISLRMKQKSLITTASATPEKDVYVVSSRSKNCHSYCYEGKTRVEFTWIHLQVQDTVHEVVYISFLKNIAC